MVKWAIILIFFYIVSPELYAQLSFEEQAQSLGLSGCTWGADGNENFGGGISFFDFDNDGWDDLTVSSNIGLPVRFYKNMEGSFELVQFPGIDDELFETKTIQWVDFDNDGDFDFFATSNHQDCNNRFYENTGDMMFTNSTVSSGLSNPGHKTFGASWGDYNKDGFLDLFIVSRLFDSNNKFNTLYKNNGDNTFSDVSIEVGLIQVNNLSFCSAWFDYDNDGWQDIYIANDKIQNKNILYHNNQDGTFTNLAQEAGVDISIDAMSTTIGDYNNDGWQDIYVTNTQEGNVFLMNNGNGTFSNIAENNGTLLESVCWGAVFLDGDNDSNIDLYVSCSINNVDSGQLSSAYYLNNGLGNYSIAENIGLENDISRSYSNCIGDITNDGKVDIAILNTLPDDIFLWHNTSSNENNWIKVKLIGTQSNRQGIGSTIELSVNGDKQFNYTLCGEGYLGQNSAYEFFGIGQSTEIDYIKVTWLSGQVDLINNPPINEHLTITEGSNPLSIETFNTSSSITTWPNPSSRFIEISNISNYINGQLTVLDLKGSIIRTLVISSENISLDVSPFPKGMYLVNLKYKNQNHTIKIIKE